MMKSLKKVVAVTVAVMTIAGAGSAFAMPYERGARMRRGGVDGGQWGQKIVRPKDRDRGRIRYVFGAPRRPIARGARGGRWDRIQRW